MRNVSHSKQYTRRLGLTILLLVLSSVLLVSCMAGPNTLWIRGLFGLDTDDYLAELMALEGYYPLIEPGNRF